jgi:hypothetical protein
MVEDESRRTVEMNGGMHALCCVEEEHGRRNLLRQPDV